MPSVSAPKFWVLNQSQIAARRSPFLSDTFIFNTTTKSLRLGPGMWADCAVLIEPDGGGDGQLTADQLAAVLAATSPSASNAFITDSVLAAGLATKEDKFIQFFQATIDGVLHNFKPNFVIGGKMSWAADEDETAVFFFDNSGAGFWKLDIGPSGVAVASDAGDEADPTEVPSWDLTGITLVVGPQVYGSTSQEAIEALAADVNVLNLTQYGKYRGKRTFSGTTDTLVLADAGGLVLPTNNGSITITVPPQGSVAFPELTTITCFPNSSAGQITFAPGSGVTLLSGGGALKTAMAYGGVSLTLIDAATNTWWVEGNLTV